MMNGDLSWLHLLPPGVLGIVVVLWIIKSILISVKGQNGKQQQRNCPADSTLEATRDHMVRQHEGFKGVCISIDRMAAEVKNLAEKVIEAQINHSESAIRILNELVTLRKGGGK